MKQFGGYMHKAVCLYPLQCPFSVGHCGTAPVEVCGSILLKVHTSVVSRVTTLQGLIRVCGGAVVQGSAVLHSHAKLDQISVAYMSCDYSEICIARRQMFPK